MLKRGITNVPQRGSQLISTSKVGSVQRQMHIMSNKLSSPLPEISLNSQELLLSKDVSLLIRNCNLFVRTVTAQPHAPTAGHGAKHGGDDHGKHGEELSTDYSQFNFVESPKETIVSVKTIRKYWELIPLLVVLGLTGLAGVLFTGYSLFTKHDVMRTSKQRHGEDKPWFHADPEKTGKLYVPYEGARKIPELEQLKKVLNE